jgi:xylulokinase
VVPRFGATGPPDFLFGNQGCISGLSLNHSRGDILHALLEGLSFYILDCFEKLHNAYDKIDKLVVTGGGSASEKWLQITADVLNKVIVRNSVTEASSLGAAIIAGVGSKMFISYSDAIKEMVHKELEIVPDQSKTDFYNAKFNRYKILAK